MSSATQAISSLTEMAGFLTAPYQRGAETLHLSLGADAANETAVDAYDFQLYSARYGAGPADPRYVLLLNADLGADPLTVEVDFTIGAATGTVAVTIPGATLSGASYCLPLPTPVNTGLRIVKLRQKPSRSRARVR